VISSGLSSVRLLWLCIPFIIVHDISASKKAKDRVRAFSLWYYAAASAGLRRFRVPHTTVTALVRTRSTMTATTQAHTTVRMPLRIEFSIFPPCSGWFIICRVFPAIVWLISNLFLKISPRGFFKIKKESPC